MDTPTITYKGELRELRLGNAAFMRFRRLGGDLAKLDADPIDQAITLACAMLDLPGDPIDHADGFAPVPQWADQLTAAVRGYLGDADAPGEPIGDAPSPTLKSHTD